MRVESAAGGAAVPHYYRMLPGLGFNVHPVGAVQLAARDVLCGAPGDAPLQGHMAVPERRAELDFLAAPADCELMLLRRSDFELVLEQYPALATHVEGYKLEKFHQFQNQTRTSLPS